MAAASQLLFVIRGRRLLLLCGVTLACLGVPAEARAHGTAPVTAIDYLAEVTSTGGRGAVQATVIDADRKLSLRLRGAHVVVVRGYEGEPFLRLSPQGAAVNTRSPTALLNRLVAAGSTPALNPRAAPVWRLLTPRRSFAWHDHRLGPRPGVVYAKGDVARWTIPIRVDGRADTISGRLRHARGPSVWLWAGLLAAVAATACWLARVGSRRLRGRVAVAAAAPAGVAAVLLGVALSTGPGRTAAAAWTDIPLYLAATAVAAVLFVRLPDARGAIAGVVGVVAALVGLGDAGVLVHGFVIASIATPVVRAATVLAVCGGVTAAILVFTSRDLLRRRPSGLRHSSTRRHAPPRAGTSRQ